MEHGVTFSLLPSISKRLVKKLFLHWIFLKLQLLFWRWGQQSLVIQCSSVDAVLLGRLTACVVMLPQQPPPTSSFSDEPRLCKPSEKCNSLTLCPHLEDSPRTISHLAYSIFSWAAAQAGGNGNDGWWVLLCSAEDRETRMGRGGGEDTQPEKGTLQSRWNVILSGSTLSVPSEESRKVTHGPGLKYFSVFKMFLFFPNAQTWDFCYVDQSIS